jgi:hypothetical protein
MSGKWARVRKTSDTIPYANGVRIFKNESELSLKKFGVGTGHFPVDEAGAVNR